MNDFPLCQCAVCAEDDEVTIAIPPMLIGEQVRVFRDMVEASHERDQAILFVSPLSSWPYLYKV